MRFDEKRFINDVHGSGLNYEPSVKRSRHNVTVKWAFQCMNDAGYYDGFVAFRLVIPLKSPDLFKVFIARDSQRKEREYQVQDYIEDVFYIAIEAQLSEGEKTLWN